jgi:hypothetical protein
VADNPIGTVPIHRKFLHTSRLPGSYRVSVSALAKNALTEIRQFQMGSSLGLAAITDARASACVSMYSRILVSLPSRTVMSKTHSSLNALFVALIFPVATPMTRTRSPCAMNSGGGWVGSFHRFVGLLK